MARLVAPSMDSAEGVLVISVWHETHGEERFRGRLSAVMRVAIDERSAQ